MKRSINWDALGMSASLICAIHCAVLPVFLTSLPIFGVELIHNEIFENFMIVLAGMIGFYSLVHGWKKHHHSKAPLLIFTVGLVLLLLKEQAQDQFLLYLIPAVALILTAHFLNYRMCRKANHCHTEDCDHKHLL
jgi:hypothetical protein